MNSALPLAPVAAFTASVQAFQVVGVPGRRRQQVARPASAKARSAISGRRPGRARRATMPRPRATLREVRPHREPERLAAVRLRAPRADRARPRRACSCTSRALRSSSSCSSNLAGAREMWAKSIEPGEFVEVGDRPHRFRRADQHRERGDRLRLEARLAQARQGEVAEPLRQPLPARRGEQVVVAEDRRAAAQSLEDLDLHRRVGDVVLAADHVGDRRASMSSTTEGSV